MGVKLKLLLQLSIFGLIMAFGTISLIPERSEPFYWLFIFVFCAWIIVKVSFIKYFWNGFALSLLNSFWITLVHLLFFRSYTAHHADMVAMSNNMPAYFNIHPRQLMLLMAPAFGVLFGVIQGLFVVIASKIIH